MAYPCSVHLLVYPLIYFIYQPIDFVYRGTVLAYVPLCGTELLENPVHHVRSVLAIQFNELLTIIYHTAAYDVVVVVAVDEMGTRPVPVLA